MVIDATGPWARTTAGYVGIELPLWHTKAEVFILVPAAGLGYPFPILKYPRFYARKDKDNIFICKAHMTMDLSDTTHAGIWDPDDLPMTGGTDAYFWEFLTGELLEVYPAPAGVVDRQRVGRLSGRASRTSCRSSATRRSTATCWPPAPVATASSKLPRSVATWPGS